MSNMRGGLSNKSFFENMYEVILCLYIIVAPIVNSLSEIKIFGYALHIIILLLLFATRVVLGIFIDPSNKNKLGASIFVLLVFLVEILIQRIRNDKLDIGLILLIFLYATFLTTPKNISIKKIYVSFYFSAIIAAIFSFVGGLSSSAVVRTATLVDGSIAIIAILIAFWGPESFKKTKLYISLKYLAIVSSFVVVAFGMSRARVLIISMLVIIKVLALAKNTIKTGKIRKSTLVIIPFLIITLCVVLQLDFVQSLFDLISNRFESGLESAGRDEEIEVGWNWFLESPLMGRGWGEMPFYNQQGSRIKYYNHCMYLAFLVRGGVLMGSAFLLSFLSIAKKVIKHKNFFGFIIFVVFLILGYGNAGLFNYTISSMLIPLILSFELKTSN